MTRLVVVGFGLVGASLAAALRARGAVEHVCAVDLASVVGTPAVRAASDQQLAIDDADAVARVSAAASVVVLAAPIHAIVAELPRALEHAPVVTDCGSVKRAVVAASRTSSRRSRFVPGHPLAGGSEAGASHARPDLFERKRWVLCPDDADPDALAEVEQLVRAVGAEPVHMRADEHDRAVALTSHVPQLLASALLVLSERRAARGAEGPGFESATRTAGGNPAVWRDILQANADEIALALRELGRELAEVAESLERNEPDGLRLLDEARRLKLARGLH